jgi:hypothetical protein
MRTDPLSDRVPFYPSQEVVAKEKAMDKRIFAAECFGTGIATKILLYPA